MDVAALSDPDPACDEFVRQSPGGRLSHLPAWNWMVERALGHQSHYLVARDGDTVRGVLPLTHVRSRLFGNRMVSQPFSNYGGPLTTDATTQDALYDHAVELAGRLGCESIEFRNAQPLPYDLHVQTDKVTFYLQLMPDPDELYRSFKRDTRVRNQVRKAEKAGIVAEGGGLELLGEFYDLYTIRMHQLGTPPYPRTLMRSILETFPDNARFFVARLGTETVAAKLVVEFNGFVQSRWGVVRVEHNRSCPNHLLYWAVLKHYCLTGASLFDFGRSTVDSSPYTFKKKWGAEMIQLHYQYWSRPGHELSLARPDNPKYHKRVETWKKLPLWVTRLVGPHIGKNLA